MTNPRTVQIETYIAFVRALVPPRGKERGEFSVALMILAGRLINEEATAGEKSKASIARVVAAAIRLFMRAAMP